VLLRVGIGPGLTRAARAELDPATPLGAWVATHFSALFITLAIACAIPLRPARPPGTPTGEQ
jgi:hypothetical protein